MNLLKLGMTVNTSLRLFRICTGCCHKLCRFRSPVAAKNYFPFYDQNTRFLQSKNCVRVFSRQTSDINRNSKYELNEKHRNWLDVINRIKSSRRIIPNDKVEVLEMLDNFGDLFPEILDYKEQINLKSDGDLDIAGHAPVHSLISLLETLCVFCDEEIPQNTMLNVNHMNSIEVFTDAGRNFLGGCWDKKWFCLKYENHDENVRFEGELINSHTLNVIYRELNAVLQSAKIWRKLWHNRNIVFHSDNLVTVWIVKNVFSHSRIPERYKKMLVELEEIATNDKFTYNSKWVSNKDNLKAHALSVGHVVKFRHLLPGADENSSAEQRDYEENVERDLVWSVLRKYKKGRQLQFGNVTQSENGMSVELQLFADQTYSGTGRDEYEARFEAARKALALSYNVRHAFYEVKSLNALNTLRFYRGRHGGVSETDFSKDDDDTWNCKIHVGHREFIGKGESKEIAIQDAAKHALRMMYNVDIVEEEKSILQIQDNPVSYKPTKDGLMYASTIVDGRKFAAAGLNENEAKKNLTALILAFRCEERGHIKEDKRTSKATSYFKSDQMRTSSPYTQQSSKLEKIETKDESVSTKVQQDELMSTELDQDESLSTEGQHHELMSTELQQDESMSSELEQDESLATELVQDESVATELEQDESVATELEQDESLATELVQDESVATELEQDESVATELEQDESVATELEQDESVTAKFEQNESVVAKLDQDESVSSDENIQELPSRKNVQSKADSDRDQLLYDKAQKLKTDGKSEIMILRLLYGSRVSYSDIVLKDEMYRCVVTVRGTSFNGEASTKQKAKLHAAQRALVELLGF